MFLTPPAHLSLVLAIAFAAVLLVGAVVGVALEQIAERRRP